MTLTKEEIRSQAEEKGSSAGTADNGRLKNFVKSQMITSCSGTFKPTPKPFYPEHNHQKSFFKNNLTTAQPDRKE